MIIELLKNIYIVIEGFENCLKFNINEVIDFYYFVKLLKIKCYIYMYI